MVCIVYDAMCVVHLMKRHRTQRSGLAPQCPDVAK